MEDVKNYFKNVWETTEEDSQVIEAVKKAKNIEFDCIKFFPFPLFPHVGPMALWGLGLLLLGL